MISDNDLTLVLFLLREDLAEPRRLAEICGGSPTSSGVQIVQRLEKEAMLDADQRSFVLSRLEAIYAEAGWRTETVFSRLLGETPPERVLEFFRHWAPHSNVAGGDHEPGGRYVDGAVHAEGGLGRILRVRDTVMDRLVALKELRPKIADDPLTRARFLREVQIAAQLEHPNIVPAYDFCPDAGGKPYYTMRFLHGRNLQKVIDEHHRKRREGIVDAAEFRRLMRYFIDICWATSFAHAHHIIHRDLKPDNIALGEFGEVYLIDWGLAKRLDESEPEWSLDDLDAESDLLHSTQAGAVVGTPAYMAPEQALGRIDDMGPHTDVFGLGAVLYAILTGEAPHQRVQATSIRHALAEIATRPPPLANTVNPKTPPALAAIADKAMAVAPKDRYADASDLGQDVGRWLDDEPVSAYSEPWMTRLQRYLKRRAVVTQAAVSLALLGMVAGAMILANTFVALRFVREIESAETVSDARDRRVSIVATLQRMRNSINVLKSSPMLPHAIHRDGDPFDPTSREHVERVLRTFFESNPGFMEVVIQDVSDRNATCRALRRRIGDANPEISYSSLPGYPVAPELESRRSEFQDGQLYAHGFWHARDVAGEAFTAMQFATVVRQPGRDQPAVYVYCTVSFTTAVQRLTLNVAADRKFYVLDAAGKVLALSGGDHSGGGLKPFQAFSDQFPATERLFTTSSPAKDTTIVDPGQTIVCCRTNPMPPTLEPAIWVVVVTPIDSAVSAFARYRQLLLAITAAIVGVAIAAIWILFRALTRPSSNAANI